MVVRLSALHAGRPLPLQEDSWYSFLSEAESTPRPVRLEGFGKLKKKSTSLGNDPATFRLVAQCLNQLFFFLLLFGL
jgi:hypothetical protein